MLPMSSRGIGTRTYFNSRIRAHVVETGGTGVSFEQWIEICEKFNNCCPGCRRSSSEINLDIDHILPVSRGGTTVPENIQPLCQSCNSKKYTKHVRYYPDQEPFIDPDPPKFIKGSSRLWRTKSNTDPSKYLTVARAAKIKGVSVHTVYKAINEGRLKCHIEYQPTYFVMLSDLAAWKPASGGGVVRAKVKRGPGRPQGSKKEKAE